MDDYGDPSPLCELRRGKRVGWTIGMGREGETIGMGWEPPVAGRGGWTITATSRVDDWDGEGGRRGVGVRVSREKTASKCLLVHVDLSQVIAPGAAVPQVRLYRESAIRIGEGSNDSRCSSIRRSVYPRNTITHQFDWRRRIGWTWGGEVV